MITKKWRSLSILLVLCLAISTLLSTPASAATPNEVITDTKCIFNTKTVSGTCTIENGATLTVFDSGSLIVDENAEIIVKNGATLITGKNFDIKGKIVVEKGGRYYRNEYNNFQEIVGTVEEADAKSGYTPLFAISLGSVSYTGNQWGGNFTFPQSCSIRVARSSIRLINETWNMDHESELIYDNNVAVNVKINGCEFTGDKAQFCRVLFGDGANNTQDGDFGIPSGGTFYWEYIPSKNHGVWCKFNGIKVMSMDPSSCTEEDLAWVKSFWANARSVEPEWTADDGVALINQIYDTTRDTFNEYNLYIPSSVEKGKPVSLIFFTHGGSWVGGSQEDEDYMCRRMAREGYITATIDYRLFAADKNAATSMDDILDDMEECINVINAQVTAMGYTIKDMATSGYSAGGHLALLYAYSRPNATNLPVVLCMDQVGPADFSAEGFAPGLFGADIMIDMFAQSKLVPGYANMTAEEKAAALAHMSPTSYINENTVPTVMAYAKRDIIAGYGHGQILDTKLTASGVDHIFYTLERSNHTCEFDSAVMDQFNDTCLDYCTNYLTSSK